MQTLPQALICVFILLSTPLLHAQEWLHYGSDEGGSKFSPLDQINADNVEDLALAWTYRHGDLEKFPERKPFAGFHATPILLPEEAGRKLVICTPFNRIAALEPDTGKEVWSYDPVIDTGDFGTRLKCLGVAYWKDPEAKGDALCKHALFMGTSDRRIISVDASSGAPCPDFGENGQVDVNPIIAAAPPNGENPWGVLFSAPPVVVNGVVVLGSINNMKNRFARAAGGAIRGFDAQTGELRWTFDPIPRDPNDPEHNNWTKESLEITGGANAWTLLSADSERDLVFIPTSSASPNFFGGTRPGDNRYANSVVALRGSTGEVVWHYQLIHHDVWDWDTPSQPMLVDITRNGKKIPVVVQLSKQGYVFMFHRETGEPFFEIEERPVPQEGAAPGEVLSPTQPFPVAPPPLMKGGITPDDAWGLTFWDKGKCREQIENANYGPLYTPPSTKGWIMYPGTAGAMNWGGGAFDPKRNLLVTNVSKVGMVLKLLENKGMKPAEGYDPRRGAPFGPPAIIQGTDYAIQQKIFLSPIFMPCTKPPWSTLVAVDLDKGEIKWEVPLGMIDRLSPIPIPLNWGTPSQGGAIITGGGLAFIGATADSRIRAFDLNTGEEIWKVDTPRSSHATPMTYEYKGKQYVVIASGGHMFVTPNDIDDYLVAYALPDK